MRQDIQAKLDALGITDISITVKVLHNKKQWSKREEVFPVGTCVDFIHPSGEIFPVAFITEDPQEARAMMKAWLVESKKI
jgi:hypothetical protein